MFKLEIIKHGIAGFLNRIPWTGFALPVFLLCVAYPFVRLVRETEMKVRSWSFFTIFFLKPSFSSSDRKTKPEFTQRIVYS
jgi:hypothetical protein